MTFKEKLVILRKSKGLTQDEFASAVGVSRQAVYKWESGQSYPEVPKLLEMKILFTISIDELLDDSYDLPLPEKKKKKRAPKVEKEAKPVAPKAPKAAPAPKVAPVAQPTPAPAPKAEPVAPATQPAPKVAPVAQPTPAPAPKAEPVAPTVPVSEPVAAPAPKAEPAPAPAPKEEPKVDTVPNPILLEDIVNEEESKAEPEKKSSFFGRLFGRR